MNSLSEVPVEKVEKISLDALAIHSTVRWVWVEHFYHRLCCLHSNLLANLS